MMCCGLFECVRGVVFVVVIFSINSCDNLCIYYFGSVSCIQCIDIKPTSKLINFPLTKITIRVIESLGHFKLFLDDLFTFSKWINNQGVPYSNACLNSIPYPELRQRYFEM